MALRNIDHFIETTEHHIEQLINIAADLEGSREVPGVLYAVYYLTRSKEAAEKVKADKEKKKSEQEPEARPEESPPSGDGGSASTRTTVQSTGEAEKTP